MCAFSLCSRHWWWYWILVNHSLKYEFMCICSLLFKHEKVITFLWNLSMYICTHLHVNQTQKRIKIQFRWVQSLSRVQLFVTPWIAAHQASLSITNIQSLLKRMSIESVMPSNHLILCLSLLLLLSIFPRIKIFSKESVLCIRWTKDWGFSFSINPSNGYSKQFSF